jgi:hypothetical protein
MKDRYSTKTDERYLEAAATELRKADTTKALANQLANREYRKAGKNLKKLAKPPAKTAKAGKKNLSKLKETARRMAKAAEKNAGSKSALAATSKELAKDVSSLEKSLKELEKQELKKGDCKACQKKVGMCQKGANDKLGKLGKLLSQLEARRKLLSRLESLRKKMGQCQGYLLGRNGIKPGSGADGSFNRKKKDENTPGQESAVALQKGQGPTAIQVEEASSGSAISSMITANRKRDFRHQVEGLVRREDVPDTLKSGVKRYFEEIHNEER